MATTSDAQEQIADPTPVHQIVVVAGMSGGGRTQTANTLEDLGWFVIDNLPAVLIPKVAELAGGPGSTYARVALVVGGGDDGAESLTALSSLRAADAEVRVLFLEASTEALIRRYKDTRRRHPHSDGSLREAIEQERELLADVKSTADLVIDTSDLNVHQLRDRIIGMFGAANSSAMAVTVMSFGYKHGLPVDVDLVFDCRFLPNPHWVEELRPQTGLDEPVREYVLGQDATTEFLTRLQSLLELVMPAYRAEGKAYLTIAMGCTGGHHRSVALAEEVARLLREMEQPSMVTHRDIEK